jgi:hypothetical protein
MQCQNSHYTKWKTVFPYQVNVQNLRQQKQLLLWQLHSSNRAFDVEDLLKKLAGQELYQLSHGHSLLLLLFLFLRYDLPNFVQADFKFEILLHQSPMYHHTHPWLFVFK